MKIDDIDAVLLRELLVDARASFTTLARKVALSPNAVAERVRRMQRDGVIRRFGVEISPEISGHRLHAWIELRFAPGVTSETFERMIAAHRRILGFAVTTGRSDCTLRVAVADQSELHSLIEELRKHGAIDTYSRIIVREELYPATF